MTVAEHEFFGKAFLSVPIALVVALVFFYFRRKGEGEIQDEPFYRAWDLIIVGGYICLFLGSWKLRSPDLLEEGQASFSSAAAWGSVAAFLLLMMPVVVALGLRGNLVRIFGLRWSGWYHVLWIAPMVVIGTLFLGYFLVQLGWEDWVTETFGGREQEMVQALMETNDLALLLAIIVSAVLVAPVVEEVIFRGYLYPAVKAFSNRWFAAVLTGAFFGLVHFNLLGLPMLILLGIVLAVIYEMTQSLWSTVITHAVFNGFMTTMMLLQKFDVIQLDP